MNREIPNIPRSGTVRAIGSKSEIQRYLIAAALSEEATEIANFYPSDDTVNAVECIRACFADVNIENGTCRVIPFENKRYRAVFRVGESATLFRLLLPVCALRGGEYKFILGESLKKRPHAQLIEQLEKNGAVIIQEDNVITVKNKAAAPVFVLPANISSQYISGMLMAMPESDENIFLRKTGKVISKPYIDLTVSTLNTFGIRIISRTGGYFINKSEKYISPHRVTVGGDWSNAAFFLGLGAFEEKGITVDGLDMLSAQGDKKIVEILRAFGADVTVENNSVTVKKNELNPIRADAEDYPDLVPIIAVLACGAKGETVISGTTRLRYKESDRIEGIGRLISSLGGEVRVLKSRISVFGTSKLKGGVAETSSDHRIIMAAAVASAICEEKVTVLDVDGVNKSYPDFFEILDSLGE